MDAIDFFSLLIPVTFFFMLVVEARWPARRFPARRGWRWIGVGFLFLLATMSTLAPLLLPAQWLAAHRLIDGSALGIVRGTLVGWIVLSFFNYLWHRNAHRFELMWRGFHQLHHSAQQVDIPGSVLFHPAEMFVFASISTVVTTLVLGLDPIAAAAVGYIAAFYGMFQHWNVRTPAWLGYVIQRPEAHCVHHQRGVHNYNFADLPVWDMLAGTFRNPPAWSGEAGFETVASKRIGSMLIWRDVNRDDYGSGSRGVSERRPSRPLATPVSAAAGAP